MKNFKTGGRIKGTPNKKTVVLEELIQNKFPDFNPILSMVELAESELTPVDLQFQCLKEVSQYLFPKRKSIEVSEEVLIEKPEITITFVGVDGKEIKH